MQSNLLYIMEFFCFVSCYEKIKIKAPNTVIQYEIMLDKGYTNGYQ